MAFVNTNLSGKLNPDRNLHFPSIQKPQALGCFSLDSNRDYKNSGENLGYFRMPQSFPLDLNKGYGTAITKPSRSEKERLQAVLHFIYNHQNELISRSNDPHAKGIHGTDFICYRGLLRVVMNTPYEWREDWCITATRFKGNIYLCERKTDQKQLDEERFKNDEHQKRCCSYGFKFEQCCMSTNPYTDPNVNVPVDECSEFHCVFKTHFPRLTLMYGAEVDGTLEKRVIQNVERKDVLNNMRFVELKCSLRPSNDRQQQNFYKFKCKNWWCQCFLAGIDDLLVGSRNEDGFIEEIVHMNVHDLPQMSSFWDPAQCVDFLMKFLHMVKNLMSNLNCPDTVYEFYFNPKSKAISYRIHHGRTEYSLLPDWYIAMLS